MHSNEYVLHLTMIDDEKDGSKKGEMKAFNVLRSRMYLNSVTLYNYSW